MHIDPKTIFGSARFQMVSVWNTSATKMAVFDDEIQSRFGTDGGVQAFPLRLSKGKIVNHFIHMGVMMLPLHSAPNINVVA